MFGFVWLTLRQAQEAIRYGRLDEALRLLGQPAARAHRRAGELFLQLARAYVERGERALRRDDPEAAWADLGQAEALETAEKGTDRLRQALTSLGVSNVSFGLAPHARAVLNSVFLHHCVQAGLDMAIVNPAHIKPYAEIDEEQRKLADDTDGAAGRASGWRRRGGRPRAASWSATAFCGWRRPCGPGPGK